MPLIQMRDVPDHIYQRLEKQAARERRSISQQAVAALARGLDTELDAKARRQKIIRSLRESPAAARLSDPVRIIRQDRLR